MKQLDRLLFEQGGECFFCHRALAKADASIEHLVASANGGPNHEDNCVACCKALNALLGSKPLKQKLQVVLNQKGFFKCPADSQQPVAATPTPSKPGPTPAKAQASATKKPSPSKPMFTLATVKAPAKPAQQALKDPRAVTCPTCKSAVPAAVGQVDYKCQQCGGAFRY